MNKKTLLKNISIFFTAFISVLGINLNLFKTFNGNSTIYVLLFPVFFILIKKALKIKSRNMIFFSALTSFCISFIQLIGYSLESANNLKYLRTQIMFNILEFSGIFIVFYCCLILLFDFLLKVDFTDKTTKGFFFANNKKSFFLIWAFIFIAWLPLFLVYFPGICSPDSISQIRQALGKTVVTSHHPICHTFLIWICMKIGNLFGSVNAGVAVYSIVQMIIMSCVFSFVIFYMSKKKHS